MLSAPIAEGQSGKVFGHPQQVPNPLASLHGEFLSTPEPTWFLKWEFHRLTTRHRLSKKSLPALDIWHEYGEACVAHHPKSRDKL